MKRILSLSIIPFILLAVNSPSLSGHISPVATYSFPDASIIHMPCGIEIDTRAGTTELDDNLMINSAQKGFGTYIVQFDGPIYDLERRALEQTGAVIDDYLPNYAYIVRMDASTTSKVASVSGITWIGDYHPGYKISPVFDKQSSYLQEMTLILYQGIDAETVRDAVYSMGGELVESLATEWETIVRIKLAPDKLEDLVHNSHIKWVEPYYQPYFNNNDAQWVLQSWDKDNKTRKIWDEGLTGEGQIVNVLDSGVRTTHNYFRDDDVDITAFGNYPSHRKIIAYQKTFAAQPTFGDDEVIGHGTHTACSAVGYDDPVGGSGENDGLATGAKLFFLDGGSNANPYAVFVGLDLESTVGLAYSGGAKVSSHSWGSQSTRAYDSHCVQADRAMWNRPDYLLVTSGGNLDGGPYTGSPGNAKNIVCVGACNDGVLANIFASSTSSSGPSGDGRIRPDVVAPGVDIRSAFSGGDASEVEYSGTSMACPLVAGAAALIRQYFEDGYAGDGFNPTAALVKAMLINSAETDYWGKPVPSNDIGWGRPNLDNALYFPGDSRALSFVDHETGLSTGQRFETEIDNVSNLDVFKVTLNWTDYPAATFASPALVNNLDLKVTSPTGKIYKGNVFGDDNESVEGGDYDALNPTENVYVPDPEEGTWSIEVSGNNVPQGPQKFALVVTFDPIGGVDESSITYHSLHLEVINSDLSNMIGVSFNLPRTGMARMEMFDKSGRLVKNLFSQTNMNAGTHNLSFNIEEDDAGNLLADDVYFIRLTTDTGEIVGKILKLK